MGAETGRRQAPSAGDYGLEAVDAVKLRSEPQRPHFRLLLQVPKDREKQDPEGDYPLCQKPSGIAELCKFDKNIILVSTTTSPQPA